MFIRAKELSRYNCLFKLIYLFAISNNRQKTQRSKREKATLPAKKNLNDRHSRDKFDWLAENNFSAGDFFLTLTFAMPLTDDEAKKFLNRFITKLRKHYRKLGLELKYLYVMEHGLTGEGEHDRLGRTHFHFLCNSGHEMLSDEEFVELKNFITELWDNGICKISDVYRTKDGLLGLCRYMLKEQKFSEKNKRFWNPSKNLKRPFEVRNDDKISFKQMQKLQQATSEEEVKRLAEIYFRGWLVVDFYINKNDVTGLPYASFKLVRKSTLPPDNPDDNSEEVSPLTTSTLKEKSILFPHDEVASSKPKVQSEVPAVNALCKQKCQDKHTSVIWENSVAYEVSTTSSMTKEELAIYECALRRIREKKYREFDCNPNYFL